MKNYSGNRLPFACVLCHSADMGRVKELLNLLEQKCRLYFLNENCRAGSRIRRCCAVISAKCWSSAKKAKRRSIRC